MAQKYPSPEVANQGFYQPSASPDDPTSNATGTPATTGIDRNSDTWKNLYTTGLAAPNGTPESATHFADAMYLQQAADAAKTDPPVYWSANKLVYQTPGSSSEKDVRETKPEEIKSASQAVHWLQEIYFNDPKEWDAFRGQLRDAGFFPGKADADIDPGDVFDMWANIIKASADLYDNGKGLKQTPFDYVSIYALRNPNSLMNLTGKPRQTVTSTDTRTSTTLDDATHIAAAAVQQGTADLGRDLTPGEQNTIVSQIQALERAHPQKTVTTSSTLAPIPGQGPSNTTTNSVTTGGVDPTLSIRDAVRDQPDYGEYQAGTYYFNALMNSLGALNQAGA